jgi:hypothetical protein
MGPYHVQKQNDRGSYELDELDGTPMNAVFAANQIKKYHLQDHIPKMEITNQDETGNELSADVYIVTATAPNRVLIDNTTEISWDFEYWQWPPVSFGPENQLWKYLWPMQQATHSWEYWSNKFIEWHHRVIVSKISSTSPTNHRVHHEAL